jgi:CRP/FNR family transcriptional regulator, cyclic AMP receptor protein
MLSMSASIADDNLEKWLQEYPFSQAVSVADKSVIYRQGDRCVQVFWVVRGIVKLDHNTPQGNVLTIALLRRGDLLGSLQTTDSADVMEETAQAIGEVHLYRCERTKFRELLSRQSDFAWQVFERLATRRRQAERKLCSALTDSVEHRVIDALLDLSNTFGIRCTHGYALEIHLTQQELADLVGANRSVVSTIMNDLRSRGLLDYTRDLICVHDTAFADFCKQIT